MREELKQLIRLQHLDTTLRNLNETQAKLQRDVAQADRDAEKAKQEFQGQTGDLLSFRKEMDRREVELKAIEEKIARLETQLNTVKTNKEYSALQHEILGFKADRSRLEDEILKMMEQTETRQKEIVQAQKQLDQSAAQTAEKKEVIRNAIEDARARMDRLEQERAELAGNIPPSFLSPYRRLLQRGDGRAMVPCRNFVCSGCRMSLTVNTVSLLMAGDKLIYCQSCGRILYLAEDEDMTNIAAAGRKEL